MRSAVYYPHTEIRHKSVLMNALLLWDEIELIVPFEGFGGCYDDPLMAEAIELIGKRKCPSDDIKRRAHDIIEEFATGVLPESFYYRNVDQKSFYQYGIWPQKFLPETWNMLNELQLVGGRKSNLDYSIKDSAGLALMSILADCCAGETRARITDRGDAYAALTNVLVGKTKPNKKNHDILIPITLKAIRATDIPLKTLIAFRKREMKESGHTLRSLRHGYVDKISEHVKRLGELSSDADIDEVNRDFEQKVADDIKDIQLELRQGKMELLLSKEIIVTTLAVAGGYLAATKGVPIDVYGTLTSAGTLATVGGIASLKNKYSASRIAIMKKHPMSYLHEIGRARP